MADEREIIEKLKPVCICKGIRKDAFLRQIRAGMRTVESLQKATGAGTGSCGGKQCTPRIRQLLDEAGIRQPGEGNRGE